jgi:radical SAM superfamily enzyme YgiQ (UPF0313 family)
VKITIAAPSRERTIWKGRGRGRAGFPPLALPVLAAVTPRDAEVRLIDENVEPIDPGEKTDLVGLSCSTATAQRGYEIADAFRSFGTPVVMGGPHPTALPKEALEHSDSVVVGEAEAVWPQVVADAKAHRLKAVYQSDSLGDVAEYPTPRRDLLQSNAYLFGGTVETGRGCPQNCKFCSVSRVFGRGRRLRPIRDVVTEMERMDNDLIIFMDDNILSPPQRAKELFREMAPLRRKWGGQSWLPPLADPELLDLARKCGCVALFVGLESISEASLKGAGKSSNSPARYKEIIRKAQDHGVGILGSFVFGFDEDDKSVFARTVEFAVKARLDVAQFSILTPYPGTACFDELHSSGRILDYNWSNYTMSQAVFQPKQMTADELKEGHDWAERSFYSLPSIARRALRIGPNFWFRLIGNWSYRRAHVGKSILPYATPGRGKAPVSPPPPTLPGKEPIARDVAPR